MILQKSLQNNIGQFIIHTNKIFLVLQKIFLLILDLPLYFQSEISSIFSLNKGTLLTFYYIVQSNTLLCFAIRRLEIVLISLSHSNRRRRYTEQLVCVRIIYLIRKQLFLIFVDNVFNQCKYLQYVLIQDIKKQAVFCNNIFLSVAIAAEIFCIFSVWELVSYSVE